MEDVIALYINSSENAVVVKTSQTPNIIFTTKHARDVLRVLYAIKMNENCDVYQLDQDDLSPYFEDEDTPDQSYCLVSEDQQSEEEDSDELDSDETNLEEEKMSTPILSMGQKIHSSIKKTKISKIEETHSIMVHLGSDDSEEEEDDDDYESSDSDSDSEDNSDSDGPGPVPILK
mmetsp:Transcript_25443/g.22607  ORF Transcript_25443/g.22607 Transcript_25443/m.22607 type:complete len:175 (+) Transcript_25443:191-715(+)